MLITSSSLRLFPFSNYIARWINVLIKAQNPFGWAYRPAHMPLCCVWISYLFMFVIFNSRMKSTKEFQSMQSISLWSASLDCCSTKPNIRFVYATKHAPARATHTHMPFILLHTHHMWNGTIIVAHSPTPFIVHRNLIVVHELTPNHNIAQMTRIHRFRPMHGIFARNKQRFQYQ